MKAVIVSKSIFIRDAQKLFPEPEWKVFAVNGAMTGWRFDTIVVSANAAKAPDETDEAYRRRKEWHQNELPKYLRPGGKFVYI